MAMKGFGAKGVTHDTLLSFLLFTLSESLFLDILLVYISAKLVGIS
jgi:hypothetical protein